MNYEDKTLRCKDCGQPCALAAAKGLTNERKSCDSCRQFRHSERNSSTGQDQRDRYPWYTPIVVKTPPPVFSPAATGSAHAARSWGGVGRGA